LLRSGDKAEFDLSLLGRAGRILKEDSNGDGVLDDDKDRGVTTSSRSEAEECQEDRGQQHMRNRTPKAPHTPDKAHHQPKQTDESRVKEAGLESNCQGRNYAIVVIEVNDNVVNPSRQTRAKSRRLARNESGVSNKAICSMMDTEPSPGGSLGIKPSTMVFFIPESSWKPTRAIASSSTEAERREPSQGGSLEIESFVITLIPSLSLNPKRLSAEAKRQESSPGGSLLGIGCIVGHCILDSLISMEAER
jgi:hypothetical protein